MPTQEPAARVTNFAEVTLGYRLEDALNESERCLLCPEAACIRGCPVEIDILGFIEKILATDYRGAYDIISDANLLPAICGRVCPQEDQCEAVCPVGQTLEPVAIGRLERWIGDMAIAEGWATVPYLEPNGLNVGVVNRCRLGKCVVWVRNIFPLGFGCRNINRHSGTDNYVPPHRCD